jgi:hypothetical protein
VRQIGDQHGVNMPCPGNCGRVAKATRSRARQAPGLVSARKLVVERHTLSQLDSSRQTSLNLLLLQGHNPQQIDYTLNGTDERMDRFNLR